VALADDGLAVDWWTTLAIASAAADLRRYHPASAAAYLEDGLPPHPQWGIRSSVRLPQDKLKATLAHLAAQGSRDFYEGDLARAIAADVQAGGGALSVKDLAAFRAHLREPWQFPIAAALCTPHRSSPAVPPWRMRCVLLQENLQPARGGPGESAYSAYALALQSAYQERLQGMDDADGRRALGAEQLATACTSHFPCGSGRQHCGGWTQTLLSIFGSKFVLPQSGVLMKTASLVRSDARRCQFAGARASAA